MTEFSLCYEKSTIVGLNIKLAKRKIEKKNRKEKLKKVRSLVDRALQAVAAGKESPIVGLTIKLKKIKIGNKN